MDISVGRHSLAHVMAQAVMEMFPGAKLGIGPCIDDGFYYDFDLPEPLTNEHFPEIEERMAKILKTQAPLIREEYADKEAALKAFAGQTYKEELIRELPEDEPIVAYHTSTGFTDLCRGPHVENTRELLSWAYKIHSVAGAYWRGSEKNPMLSRLYVYAFPKRDELKAHIAQVEEARKRDHNKLGRSLGYFTTSEMIGQGLPILMPNGAKVIQILQRFVEDEEERRGYQLTRTPSMAKNDLYRVSGHWDHYRDGMFILGHEEDPAVFALRPMTCPFQFQVYLSKLRSYRELPLRYNETATLFRNEGSGEMHGLIRVRQFTLSEGHIACLPEQLEDEFRGCVDLAMFMLNAVGLVDDVSFRFSKWDESNREKYIGDAAQWESVQARMKAILDHLQVDYVEADGEAAFYGPKLDLQIRNVFGKEDTLITIQIDFQLAGRFGMEYVASDGSKQYPYIIHRSSIGCYERTLALLIEKYAGAFPFWLAPVQVGVVPVRQHHNDCACEVISALKKAGLRCEALLEDEGMGGKVNKFRQDKVPYTLIIGDREAEAGTVSVKIRGGKQAQDVPLEAFVKACVALNEGLALELAETF
ncbi:MAG: threonine--tRNA ligase [Oscillospiraceae bacterium]|jgi:threonyl-tRNA synthetase|nr:threonine--tRNA ligase [Oscillospiraceae bacterium]